MTLEHFKYRFGTIARIGQYLPWVFARRLPHRLKHPGY